MKEQSFIPLLVIAAGLFAYYNSFTGPFILDDVKSVLENQTIRQLWPVWPTLAPLQESGTTVAGRPFINLSLAVNYAFGGSHPWGYHVLNLAIHIFAGLTLFGIVRRTLVQPALRENFGAAALPLALAIAVIWVVHPLQTESVAYISQRAESTMGLFYLLTLYCAIRWAQADSPSVWCILSVASCLLGVASKEVIVSAPLIVLLYDRTFLSGSFAEAWRKRWRLYVALVATWIPLGYIVISTGNRGGSAGFGTGVAWQAYALTQVHAIAHYVRLSVWPHPLVFDYGAGLVNNIREIVPDTIMVTVMLLGTLIALCRWPTVGFLGAWLFVILAPTSSVVPVATQTIAEHRMYLPLAAVITLAAVGVFLASERWKAGAAFEWGVSVAVVLLLMGLTIQRNRVYGSELAIWQDTVAKRPDNPRAHDGLGLALAHASRFEEAIGQYEQALRIKPDFDKAHCNLGVALLHVGRTEEAIEHWEQTVRISPGFAEAHNNLGTALAQMGRMQEAMQHWQEALRLDPELIQAHYNLGLAMEKANRLPEAVGQYEQALRIKPEYAEAQNALARLQAASEAGPPR